MGKHSVDIILSAQDKYSAAFDRFEERMTDMQRRIAGQFGGTPSGFAGSVQKQFEARTMLEDKLFELTHGAKETELRDTERYFSELRNQFKDNQSMLTLIEQNETAKRLNIEKEYAEGSLATFRKWRTEYLGIIRTAAIGALAIRGLEGITGAAIALRDKGFRAGYKALVEGIPIIGASMNRLGDNIAELIVNSNAKVAESNKAIRAQVSLGKLLNELTSQRKDILTQIETLNFSASERAKYDLDRERERRLEEVKAMQAKSARMWESGIGAQSVNLYWGAEEQRELTETLYNKGIAKLSLDEQTKKAKTLGQALADIADEIYRMNYGEDELLRAQLIRTGLLSDDIELMDQLLAKRREEKEFNEAEKERLSTEEKIRDTLKGINEELDTSGMDRYQKMVWDLIQMGAPDDAINAAIDKINKIPAGEGINKSTLGPTPGWAPFESKTLRGITSGSAAINYEAQTANNTRDIHKLLVENNRLLKQFISRNKNIQTVKIADIN